MSNRKTPAIGDPVKRIDGLDKVLGRQIYPSDLYLDGMLELAVFRSPHPHARILSLDTTIAEQALGVVCVITADEVPGELVTG